MIERSGSATAHGISFPQTKASVYLDAIRALAACMVLLEHWRNLFFVDFQNISAHGLSRILYAVLYLLSSTGHQAVIIFFVLSGYLIGGTVFRSFEKNTWSWSGYLTHRCVRLWIVVIPALVLGGLLDVIGLHVNIAHALYTGHVHNHLTGNVAASLNAPTFVKNLFFLQTIISPPLGSNGPLWSLANEFWYYILFPAALCALLSFYKKRARVIFAILFIAVAVFIGKPILELFPIWLMGVALNKIPQIPFSHGVRIATSVLYLPIYLGVALLSRRPHSGGPLLDTLLGVFTTFLLWTLLSSRGKSQDGPFSWLSRKSSSVSFSMYALHFPFLLLLTGLMAGNTRWQPDGSHLAIAFGALLLVVAYGVSVASQTELRTPTVRRYVEAKVKKMHQQLPFNTQTLRAAKTFHAPRSK